VKVFHFELILVSGRQHLEGQMPKFLQRSREAM
jgi:hypothetical protein